MTPDEKLSALFTELACRIQDEERKTEPNEHILDALNDFGEYFYMLLNNIESDSVLTPEGYHDAIHMSVV